MNNETTQVNKWKVALIAGVSVIVATLVIAIVGLTVFGGYVFFQPELRNAAIDYAQGQTLKAE